MIRVLVGTEQFRMMLHEKKLTDGYVMTKVTTCGPETESILKSVGLFQQNGIVYETGTLKKEEELFALCKKYVSSSSLILIKCKEMLGTTRFSKWLTKNNCLISCGKLEQKELTVFILRGCEKYGVKMREPVLMELIRRSGYLTDENMDLNRIQMLVKQLSCCRQPVTLDDVDELLEESQEANAFRLSDCFAQHDRCGFVTEAHKLVQKGEDFIRVSSLLYRNFRIIYKAHTLKGLDEKKMREELGLNYYAWKNLRELRSVDMEKVYGAMNVLEQGMETMRQNGYQSEPLFYTMIGKLALLI